MQQSQADELKSYLDDDQYAAGYRYLQSIVRSDPNHSSDTGLKNLDNWLGKAVDINGDPSSVYGGFVRGTTEGLGDYPGLPILHATLVRREFGSPYESPGDYRCANVTFQ